MTTTNPIVFLRPPKCGECGWTSILGERDLFRCSNALCPEYAEQVVFIKMMRKRVSRK